MFIVLMLGIDYGLKRIGLAIGDTELKIIKPLRIISNDKNTIDTLKEIIHSYNVRLIVLGYPLTLSGKEGQRARKVKKFYELLKKEIPIDITLFDERYSTMEAKELSKEKHIDHISAYIILRDYVETL